jgi:adenine-specific DNA-methyltransferase
MTPINFWSHQYAAHTDQANREIKELFGDKVFDTPKPVLLVQRMLEHGTNGDDIVLDFFAGTGTTGHAVLAQNASDGRARRFILVQLPEPLDLQEPGQAVAARFCDSLKVPRTLSEITKERLRRAGRQTRDASPLFKGDVGFRAFRLASSNIRAWEPNPADLPSTLRDSVEHLKTDRTEQDILFELILKLGLDLTIPIQHKQIAGTDVYSIGAGALFVCLAERVGAADVEPLALGIVAWHRETAPTGETVAVFRDSAFVDDVAKTNLAAILEQSGLSTVRSL